MQAMLLDQYGHTWEKASSSTLRAAKKCALIGRLNEVGKKKCWQVITGFNPTTKVDTLCRKGRNVYKKISAGRPRLVFQTSSRSILFECRATTVL